MRQRLTLLLSLCLLANLAVAKEMRILNMDLSRDEVVVTNDDARRLEDGDQICFYRGDMQLACGLVTSVTPFDANVKLTSPGEHISAEKTEQDTASESYVELVFERVELQKTDRAEFKGTAERTPADLTNKTLLEGLVQLRRSVATQKDNLYGKEDLLGEVEANSGGIEDPYHHQYISNVSLGVNYIFPSVSYQQAISKNFVLSVNPILINTPSGSGTVSGYGGYLTANHYGLEAFHGDWVQLGLGFMKLKSGSAEWTSPALMATAGWRWFWDEGLNFGLGMGIQYMLTSKPADNPNGVDFSGLLPCVVLDFGFAF